MIGGSMFYYTDGEQAMSKSPRQFSRTRDKLAHAGWSAAAFFGLTLLALAVMPASADKGGRLSLVMIKEDGCRYCILWDNEVGRTYSKTEEGRRAPLVRVDINSAAARKFARVVYTPTFILVRSDGWEVGRIVGYPGADNFWGAFGKLLTKAGKRGTAGDPPAVKAPSPSLEPAALQLPAE